MQTTPYSTLLRNLLAGQHLSREQAHAAFSQIMDGQWSEAQVAGVLVAMAMRGETVDEIAGAAQAMREHVVAIDAGGLDVIDTCGTGGTGLPTFNISTCSAMVAAGAGAKVAKHGNRTSTRASGSADVLAALGVKIDATPEVVSQCLQKAGVCFCFAVRCHPAMKFAAPVRKSLGVRTLFNLLGPLTNPAGARRQLMGVFLSALTPVIAQVLAALGAVRAIVMHAQDGLDELSTTSPTQVSELREGQISTTTLTPESLGLPRARLEDLLVTSAEHSAAVIRQVLSGQAGPARDIVLLNTAAALVVAGLADDLPAGLALAKNSIDSGAAGRALQTLIDTSNA